MCFFSFGSSLEQKKQILLFLFLQNVFLLFCEVLKTWINICFNCFKVVSNNCLLFVVSSIVISIRRLARFSKRALVPRGMCCGLRQKMQVRQTSKKFQHFVLLHPVVETQATNLMVAFLSAQKSNCLHVVFMIADGYIEYVIRNILCLCPFFFRVNWEEEPPGMWQSM